MKTPFTVLEEMGQVLNRIDERQYSQFVQLLQEEARFFIFGEGRSGLIGKAIAMRLMHCGKKVYAVGESTTPSIKEGDILIVISGSGTSIQLDGLSRNATKAGARVVLVTADPAKLQAEWCTGGLVLPAATKHRKEGEPATVQPLGSQFDQAAHLVLDAAIVDGPYHDRSHETLKRQHTNLE